MFDFDGSQEEMSDVGTVKVLAQGKVSRIGGVSKLDLLVDGKKVGDVAVSEEKTFQLDAGQHSVQAKCGQLSSELLDITLDQNRSVQLECGFYQMPKGFWLWFAIVITSALVIIVQCLSHSREVILLTASAIADVICLASGLILLRIIHRPGATCYLKIVDDEQPKT